MKLRRFVFFVTLAVHATTHAALTRPIDIAYESLRYRHNPDAMAAFGVHLADDPLIVPAARQSLYFFNGHNAFRAGRYLEALQNYGRAIDMLPTAPAFNDRGIAYAKLGDGNRAARDFSFALKLQSNNFYAWRNLGNVMLERDQYAAAVEKFSEAIRDGDRRPQTYLARGFAYQASGNRSAALRDYDVAIELAPWDPRGYTGKGDVLNASGQPGAAVSEYTIALKLGPGDIDTSFALASVLAGQHRYGEAAEVCTGALRLHPRDAALLRRRADAYWKMGRWTSAIADFSSLIALEPHDELLHRLRGSAYLRQQSYPEAIADFKDAVRIAPQKARGYVLWARALDSSGRTRDAIDTLSHASKLKPDDVDFSQQLSFEFEELGDYAGAVQTLDTLLQAHPADTHTRILLADDQNALGLTDDAAQNYAKASVVAPNSGDLLFGRARLEFYTGDFRSAWSDLDRLESLSSNKPPSDNTRLYHVIWRHLAALRLGIDDRSTLRKDSVRLAHGSWPNPLLAFLAGDMSASAVLASAGQGSAKDRANQRCEAFAYVGEWRLTRGDRRGARQDFEVAGAECPGGFVERELALRELERLGP